MGSYVAAIWKCRYFWSSLVMMDLRTRYRRSLLGMGWSLLHPIAMTTILCIVFSTILKVQVREYAPFLLAGLATWNFLTTSAHLGCQCFFQGESYIRQYPAPLAIYPLRTALGGVIHFLLALVVTLALRWYFKGFDNLFSLTSLVPTMLLLFVLAWSMAVLAGFANVHFQDTQHLTEIGFQILYYASGIMFQLNSLPNNVITQVLKVNPIVSIVQLVRAPVVDGTFPLVADCRVACLATLGLALTACLTLARLQKRLIFHL